MNNNQGDNQQAYDYSPQPQQQYYQDGQQPYYEQPPQQNDQVYYQPQPQQQPNYQSYDQQAVPINPQDNGKGTNQLLVDQSLNPRLGFIRKVYGILTVQLIFTTLFVYWAYATPVVRDFMMGDIVVWILCFIIAISIEIAILCYHACTRNVPTNYICLSIFTVCFSYIVAHECVMYMVMLENGVQLVMMAFTMTACLTFGLTLYACTTKTDFTVCGYALFIVSISLLIFGIFAIIFQSPLLYCIYCVLGAILFSIYIIYDTQLILGNGEYKLSPEDYIVGALILYIDIIILFLKILRILAMVCGKK